MRKVLIDGRTWLLDPVEFEHALIEATQQVNPRGHAQDRRCDAGNVGDEVGVARWTLVLEVLWRGPTYTGHHI